MASTMASTTLLLRPSEKLGTHWTSVGILQKNNGRIGATQHEFFLRRVILSAKGEGSGSAALKVEEVSSLELGKFCVRAPPSAFFFSPSRWRGCPSRRSSFFLFEL